MSFADFEDQLAKDNRKLKVLFITSFFISVVILALVLTQRTYFIYKGGEIFEERLLSVRVCEKGFMSIIQGEPHPHFVTSGVISLLSEVDFTMSVDRILKLQSLEKGACKIIIESEDELLAFKLTLLKKFYFPFDYKLNQIDELPVKEESHDVSYNR